LRAGHDHELGSAVEQPRRQQQPDPTKGGTFRSAEARLPDIAAMGFDVLYLPPVHPIGTTYRKGRNNALVAGPLDPGSPWGIGSAEGGHTAIHPELGTIDDFDRFVRVSNRLGLEVALDIAFQASPDHPWVKEHPGWFRHRPDGSIKYAENPPKKYQDIYPLDFESPDWRDLWAALRDVFLFWIEHGVRIFRVDNPHTKAFRFWEWCIAAIRQQHPDVICFTSHSLELRRSSCLSVCRLHGHLHLIAHCRLPGCSDFSRFPSGCRFSLFLPARQCCSAGSPRPDTLSRTPRISSTPPATSAASPRSSPTRS
jgi:glycosidase